MIAPYRILFENFENLKITVTGGAGFVGRHLIEILIENRAQEKNIFIPRSRDCDLRDPTAAQKAVAGRDLVFHLAARVGGIGLNQNFPADLIYDNAMMGLNVIQGCQKTGVRKLVVAGTVCAYPKFTPIPFKEENLWDGYPEETNAPYGVAKKMLLVALQSYRTQHNLHGIYLMPANLYGPFDNFDLEASHVIPALIRKFVEGKKHNAAAVTLWGDGSPSREFLFVDDAARGLAEAALKYDGPDPVNLGTHEETKIKDLAELVKKIVGYSGEIKWDASRPNGQPKRQLDTTRAFESFGFKSQVSLSEGLTKTINWYLAKAHGE